MYNKTNNTNRKINITKKKYNFPKTLKINQYIYMKYIKNGKVIKKEILRKN